MKLKILIGPGPVKLKCSLCGTDYTIEANRIELYTPDIRKNWKCLNCQTKK